MTWNPLRRIITILISDDGRGLGIYGKYVERTIDTRDRGVYDILDHLRDVEARESYYQIHKQGQILKNTSIPMSVAEEQSPPLAVHAGLV